MIKTMQRYLWWGSLGLFCYMPFHIFISQWLSTYTGGLEAWKAAKDFLTILVTILCIATVLLCRVQSRAYLTFVGLVGLYAALHVLMIYTTNQPTDTGYLATIYNLRLFGYAIIGYSLALLMPKARLDRTFTRVLIVLSTIVCLVALVQWVAPKDLMTHFGYSIERGVKPNFFIDDKPDLPRVFSTLRDPNSLGAFLILPIVILSQALMTGWRTNRRMLLSGLLLLHVLALLLTFSRSTLLATVVALAALAGLMYGRRAMTTLRKPAAMIAVGIFCIATIGGVFVLRDQYVVQNLVFHADESTQLADPNELRVSLLQRSLDGIIDQPLGHGPGMAGLVSTRLPNGLLTENYYLQIAYEVGLFGLALFLILLWLLIKPIWLQRHQPQARALLAGFVGLTFACLFFHTWANESVAIAWFLLAGLRSVNQQER